VTLRLDHDEEAELRVLVADAWSAEGEAREAACAAIVAWADDLVFHRARRLVWRRQARREALLELLRQTDPDHLKGGGRDARAA
jgi:hypothetical protein